MYKVVIIDDEPIIVEGLSRSIPWGKWGCEVVATAQSGEEGRKVILKNNPDLLFSDIHMPGISGLHMIAGLRSEYPRMEITILTGYRDFEYAREAIRLGVTRFLLKPSKMDELFEAVETMVLNLQNKFSQKERLEEDLNESLKPEETEGQEAGSFIVNHAVAYIEKNYAERLKLINVAEQVYVSQWHLSKLLNRYLGQSFSELLNHIRIDKAKELLCDPALRIGDIAECVGFLDMAHFSRVFKKQTGVSANEYRNSLPKEA